jgi:uncharacterized protein YjiS (DUF1127 family)
MTFINAMIKSFYTLVDIISSGRAAHRRYNALNAMSERQLKDLGLCRNDIVHVAFNSRAWR